LEWRKCEGERGKRVGGVGWKKELRRREERKGERNRGGAGRSADRKPVQPVSGQTVQ
jgi:hypothetical protein